MKILSCCFLKLYNIVFISGCLPSCRYVIVYFSILYLRHRAGFVTNEMLSLPQAPFLAVGLFEALAAASGMAAASKVNVLLYLNHSSCIRT